MIQAVICIPNDLIKSDTLWTTLVVAQYNKHEY